MRKLAIGSLAFSAGIFAANYILPVTWLIVPAVLLAVGGAMLLALKRRWLRGVVIAMLCASLGLLDFYVHYQLTAAKAEALAGETRQMELRLLTYPTQYDDYCRAQVRIIGSEDPNLKAIFYDNSSSIGDLKPGDTVMASCKLSQADKLYGEDYDYYYSVGIYMKLNSKGAVETVSRSLYIPAIPVRLSHLLSERVERAFPSDTAQFMKSLMLGDKSGLYDDEALLLALSRAGFMHIVAVSGMHIAFLVGFLRLILGASRKSSVVCLVFVWCFTLITGAGSATMRAAFMQSFLLLASMAYRENDPITSLSFALAVLLVINPFASASVSLQLSFGAMAGILCYSGRVYDLLSDRVPEKRRRGAVRYALATVSSSLSVMVFIIPLMAVHFGYVSLLSVLTNIAGLWAVSLCFCGGWISCLLSVIPPLGALSAAICSWLARYIFLVAEAVSHIPFAALYMETGGAWLWLIVSCVMFIAFSLTKLRPILRLALPGLISLSLLAAVFIHARLEYRNGPDTFSVIDVGQGQSIVAMSGDSTVMLDCGNSFCMDNAGELAGAYLHSCGRDKLDLLVLTHLHQDHANGVTMLMETVDVDTIMLPIDVEDTDNLLDGILAGARRLGTDIVYIDENTHVSAGEISMELYAPSCYGNENERCLMVRLSMGDFDALITGDSPMELERELVEENNLSGIELLVVGHHGSGYSSSEDFLQKVEADYAVISTGFNNYGHPTEETLERLRLSGYNILRTDMDGTVEIRMG